MAITCIQKEVSLNIQIEGLVQGVGFRPHIYKLALKYKVRGWVRNSFSGVEIHAEGLAENSSKFLVEVREKKPKAAAILSLKVFKADCFSGYKDFRIIATSDGTNDNVTQICPDIDVCEDCLEDLKTQKHRINYPFINCTNCGPRFSIIQDLPYDRPTTSMHKFIMCQKCEEEYLSVLDRRYHAQPVACNHCGPFYTFYTSNQKLTDFKGILVQLIDDLKRGKIIAIKGLGGFNLICDATNVIAVKKLRKLKQRDSKPFAVMFPDVQELKNYTLVKEKDIEELVSWKKPIVLVEGKQKLPKSVSSGFLSVGAILPYLPLHHLLFKTYTNPVVFTSANFADEPIIIDNEIIQNKVFSSGVSILEHNRDIVNRVDDSVVKIVNNKSRIIRRSRGYVPEQISFAHENVTPIFGAGAELSACFAISIKNSILPGQFIGDIKNAETMDFYEEAFQRFCQMYRFTPELAVHDLHPDYLSTRFVKNLGVPNISVQHHHAHIAACMAENNESKKVIGVCFDGTGLGTDGNTWGSEFMIADYVGFDRLYALDYVPISGGDSIVKDTWKSALSYLHASGFSIDQLHVESLPIIKEIPELSINNYQLGLQKQINTHLSCSMGRLFDAVAALTGICITAGFQSEAPMRLENCLNMAVTDAYPITVSNEKIMLQDMLTQIMGDIKNKITADIISTRFHNAIIDITCKLVSKIRRDTGLNKVVLSGGVFQNAYLLGNIEEKLMTDKMEVLQHQKLPYNDGNIAVGQVAIASHILT